MNRISTPRVLHVVENLDRGAVENWLLRMLEHANRRGIRLDWSFYCQLDRPGALDEKARTLGAAVIHSPVPIGSKARFIHAFRRELKHGRYDVLHCHHDLISAVYLAASLGLTIDRRIVQVHNADEEVLTSNALKRRLYREPLRLACLYGSNSIAANSNHALDTFLAHRKRREDRDIVCYYGVDPAPFEKAAGNRAQFRRDLAMPEDALIVLFAGRLVPEKNPLFAVDVTAELHRRNPRVFAVFAGAGSLESALRDRADALKISQAVRLIGWRNDLPEVMSCCDWFILPRPESPMEGFGLAVAEAQLAGLRLLVSRGIADDPLLPGACFRRLPLASGPIRWAEAALELLSEAAPQPRTAFEALRRSPMDMDNALSTLLALHSKEAAVLRRKNGLHTRLSGLPDDRSATEPMVDRKPDISLAKSS